MTARVLLVEDNQVNSYLASFLLEQAGFTVEVATNGRAAFEAALATRPDIVLMDLRMPVLDGYEATRLFKAEPSLAGVPVVALSAHALPQEKALAIEAGCVAHIEKPIDIERFVEQVRARLAAP